MMTVQVSSTIQGLSRMTTGGRCCNVRGDCDHVRVVLVHDQRPEASDNSGGDTVREDVNGTSEALLEGTEVGRRRGVERGECRSYRSGTGVTGLVGQRESVIDPKHNASPKACVCPDLS